MMADMFAKQFFSTLGSDFQLSRYSSIVVGMGVSPIRSFGPLGSHVAKDWRCAEPDCQQWIFRLTV